MSDINTATRIQISGGRVIDPANNVDTVQDVYIADGKVIALGHAPQGFRADMEIDASQHIVCPGLIDISARLREPGQEQKATIATESLAAASSFGCVQKPPVTAG
jgi:dihydroorotase